MQLMLSTDCPLLFFIGVAVGDVDLYFLLIFMLLNEGRHATEDD
jgi:hypothetical protein